MTRPLTPKQQLAKIKQAVDQLEQAANTLIAVKCGKDCYVASVAEQYQREMLTIAQVLKREHDNWERVMEGQNEGRS